MMQPIIRKPTQKEKEEASNWPIWEKEKSEFPYEYDDKETCLILEGEVIITDDSGKHHKFAAGDYVIFPKGLNCTWKILKDVRKHYKFG